MENETLDIKINNFFSTVTTKPLTYYKGIRMKADTGLHAQIAEIICRNFPVLKNMGGGQILDFGCGEGALSERLMDLGYNVFSVDIDEVSFKAHTKFEQLDFNDDVACKTFFERHENEFDMVLGLEVIEHLENPWSYIRDLKRLCKNGGYLLISTPNITSWYSRVNFLLTGRFHQFEDGDRHYGHINPVAIDELSYIAHKEGLQEIEVLPGGWLPRIWLPKGLRQKLKNLVGFFLSFFMKGLKNGWCVIALYKKI